jgi:hypothetical protein
VAIGSEAPLLKRRRLGQCFFESTAARARAMPQERLARLVSDSLVLEASLLGGRRLTPLADL